MTFKFFSVAMLSLPDPYVLNNVASIFINGSLKHSVI